MNVTFKNYFFIFIGIIGSLITLCGLSQDPAQMYYVIGSSLLLATAIYFQLFYFIALELILIAGHGTILLDVGSVLHLALPLLLCIQLMVFYFLSGRLNNVFLIIGVVGIALISAGFAYNNQWVFFSGSTGIAIYAYYSAQKNKACLLWAIVNTLFAIISLVRIVIPFIN